MNRHRQNYIPTQSPRWYESWVIRLILLCILIAGLGLITVLVMIPGQPTALETEQDIADDLVAAQAQAKAEAGRKQP